MRRKSRCAGRLIPWGYGLRAFANRYSVGVDERSRNEMSMVRTGRHKFCFPNHAAGLPVRFMSETVFRNKLPVFVFVSCLCGDGNSSQYHIVIVGDK